MKTTKLVAGTYEIDSQFHEFTDYLDNSSCICPIGWIDTAITYNNDDFVNKWHGNIISKISPFMTESYEFWVSNHLLHLNRDTIDIMLVHNTRNSSWLQLYGRILEDERFTQVGVSNVSIPDLQAIKDTYGDYPKWVETEINPFYYDTKLINFCKASGIKLIAYAIFGGKYHARSYIQEFTIPAILDMVDKVADKVIVRWDSPNQYQEILDSCQVRCDLPINPNKLKFSKSIIPNLYSAPMRAKVDKDGFPVYFNEGVVNSVTDINLSMPLCDKIYYSLNKSNIPNLEFITEYMAWLRYKGLPQRIAILDEESKLTKVNSLNSVIITKYEVKQP